MHGVEQGKGNCANKLSWMFLSPTVQSALYRAVYILWIIRLKSCRGLTLTLEMGAMVVVFVSKQSTEYRVPNVSPCR